MDQGLSTSRSTATPAALTRLFSGLVYPIFRHRAVLALSLGLVCTLGLSGCAGEKSEESASAEVGSASYFEVKAETTPFYKLGPQQPQGPDLSLERGRTMKLIRRSFGFSYVELDNGWQGYVATGDIKTSAGDFGTAMGADHGLMPEQLYGSEAITQRYTVGDDGEIEQLEAGFVGNPDADPVAEMSRELEAGQGVFPGTAAEPALPGGSFPAASPTPTATPPANP